MRKQLPTALVGLFAVLVSFVPPAAATTTVPLDGVWVTADLSEITIEYCEIGYCGFISKIVVPPDVYIENKETIDAIGIENLLDYNNRDPELRTRRMQGLRILELTEREDTNKYRGQVYNPEDGNKYTGIVEVIELDLIRLTGCGFFDLICSSEDWSRAPEE